LRPATHAASLRFAGEQIAAGGPLDCQGGIA